VAAQMAGDGVGLLNACRIDVNGTKRTYLVRFLVRWSR
jgi:hypothetical protein